MRKCIISSQGKEVIASDFEWLDIESLAQVELSSEDVAYPIESALLPNQDTGWSAADSGKQTIRLIFDSPQHINHIRLHFVEDTIERTQEFVLRWSADSGKTFQEIVRQQWCFSPDGSTSELEDIETSLTAVSVLELIIIPNISGGNAKASLKQLRLA